MIGKGNIRLTYAVVSLSFVLKQLAITTGCLRTVFSRINNVPIKLRVNQQSCSHNIALYLLSVGLQPIHSFNKARARAITF